MTLKTTSRRCLFAFAAAIAMALPMHAFGTGLQPTTVKMDAEPGTSDPAVRDARLSIGADGTQELDLLVKNAGNAQVTVDFENVFAPQTPSK